MRSGWHYSRDLDCFVNGHYTDNRCTAGMGNCSSIPLLGLSQFVKLTVLARLGGCGGADDDDAADPF
jgi:hypothetical protein